MTWLGFKELDDNTARLFVVENPNDCDNVLSVARTKGGRMSVSVSDEQMDGSYNEQFECSITLPREEVVKLAAAIEEYLKSSP